MEFLPYDNTLRTLGHHAIGERPEGDLMRFALSGDGSRPSLAPRRIVIGPPGVCAEGGADRVEVAREGLPAAAEQLVNAAHLTEFVLIPALAWGPILDLLAFDLASDEEWLEVDAEASLHQKSRDPLGLGARSRHFVRTLAESLLKSADGPRHDMTIASLTSPFILEIRHEGALVLQCPAPQCETLTERLVKQAG